MPARPGTAGGGREINSHLEAWTKSVAKALSHPTRMGILERMEKVGQTSPSEAADGGSASLPAVAYHMRELKAAGLIKATMTRPARGAGEHFYELTDRGHPAVQGVDKGLDPAPGPAAGGSEP